MSVALKVARHLATVLLTLLLGTFVAVSMIRLAPGFDLDEHALDSRLTHESREAFRAQRAQNSNIGAFYIRYVRAVAHGEFGTSTTLNRSVRDLLVERAPATAKIVSTGMLLAWLSAALLAAAAILLRSSIFEGATVAVTGLVLCVPTALFGLLIFIFRAPASLAIALVVFPKAFRYSYSALREAANMPHVLAARARGIAPLRVLFNHILPVCASPLLALLSVSATTAVGAAVPIEALCGIPGIGQLAWQAALGRDLPLLITITMFVMTITLVANAASDVLMAHGEAA